MNWHRRFIIPLCFCFIFVGMSMSADIPQNLALKEARILFYQSVENSETIEKAISQFNEIRKNNLYEGVALTYIGALTALKGKFTFFPLKKYNYVIKGLTLMDEGVLKSPNNIEARFVRGMTCYYLPFFFKRKYLAVNDFKQIVKLLNTSYDQYNAQMVMNVTAFLLENAELSNEEIKIVKGAQKQINKHED